MFISKCYSGILHAGQFTNLVSSYIQETENRCSLASDWLYYGLLNNQDFNPPNNLDPIPQDIVDAFKQAVQSGNKSQNLRDAVLTLIPTTRKTERKESTAQNQLVLEMNRLRKIHPNIILPKSVLSIPPLDNSDKVSMTELDRRFTWEIDKGFAHALSFISNDCSWREKKEKWHNERKQWLQKNHFFFKSIRPNLEILEKKAKQEINKQDQLKNPVIIQIAETNNINLDELYPYIENNIIFNKNWKRYDSRPKYSNKTGLPHLKKDCFSIEWSNNKNGLYNKGIITFKKNINVIGGKSFLFYVRPFSSSWTVCGFRIHRHKEDDKFDIDFRMQKEIKRLCPKCTSDKTKFNKEEKTLVCSDCKHKWVKQERIAFADIGWTRDTIIKCNGSLSYKKLLSPSNHQNKILEEYNQLRREKRKIPIRLKRKIAHIKDDALKQAVRKIVDLCIENNLTRLVIESVNKRKKRIFLAKGTTRKQERRTNYLASVIRLSTFVDKLTLFLADEGIYLEQKWCIKSKNKDKKRQQYYRLSQTCPRCKRLGVRYNIYKEETKLHGYGKFFACECGYKVDSDILAVNNLSKVYFDKHFLPGWKSNDYLSNEQKQEIMDKFVKKHLS